MKLHEAQPSAILPSSLERVCEVRKGRKMNFDIRKVKNKGDIFRN